MSEGRTFSRTQIVHIALQVTKHLEHVSLDWFGIRRDAGALPGRGRRRPAC